MVIGIDYNCITIIYVSNRDRIYDYPPASEAKQEGINFNKVKKRGSLRVLVPQVRHLTLYVHIKKS